MVIRRRPGIDCLKLLIHPVESIILDGRGALLSKGSRKVSAGEWFGVKRQTQALSVTGQRPRLSQSPGFITEPIGVGVGIKIGIVPNLKKGCL